MDLDDIVLVVDAQMPVRAKRIKYYEDRFFKRIFDKQSGGLPYPSATHQMRGLQGQIKALEQKIGSLQVTSDGEKSGSRRPEIEGLVTARKNDQPDASPDVQAYQNATARVDQFLEKAAAE
jgi:type IV secretion system protein VirD4